MKEHCAAGAPSAAGPEQAPVSAPNVTTTLTIHPDPLSVRRVAGWLAETLAALPAAEAAALLARLELSVHEVCMNSVDHADLPPNSEIRLRCRLSEHAVVVEVTDSGRRFQPDTVREPEPGVPQIRGYGLMIIRRMVDEFSYQRRGADNVWSLRVDRLPARGAVTHD